MTSAAAIIDALNARDTPRARLRQAARESWTHWLDRLAGTPGRVTGAPAEQLVELFMAREPAAPPRRVAALGRWQAFATLWRQHWHPAARDERRWRWTAGGVSFGWHVLVAILLLIVTALRPEPAPPAKDDAVQVEYVGRGTPAEPGGGPAPSPASTPREESPAAAARAAAAQPASPAASSAAPATPAAATAAAPPATPPQPVRVSKPVSQEPPTFVLPPTTLPSPTVDVARTTPAEVQVRDVPTLAEAPHVAIDAPRAEIVPRATSAPSVEVREIPTLAPAPAATAPVASPVEVARASTTTPSVAVREVPMASPAPGVAASQDTAASRPSVAAKASAADASAAASTARRAASAAAGPATARPSAGIGTGPKPTAAPGSWATPNRADDWGESARNRPGNALYDGSGHPRLAERSGSASAPHPPGMITDEIRDIDRAGTWLRRKPFPYEPSRWDRLWRPNETLLQEWVSKGVKQVGIPVPGSSKRIVCVISILQLGGGCGIDDPDMQDQPAIARPPPDVPFKPQLQEGNGAAGDGRATSMPPLPGLFAPPKTGVPPGVTRDKD